MNTLHFVKSLKKIFLLFLVILFSHQEGISQKNIVKVTPVNIAFGKVNVSYERKINKTWSLLVDAQHWFLKDKKVDNDPLFEINFSLGSTKKPPILGSNKGTRFSLGIRGYSLLKETEKKERKFYFGAGGFIGQHQTSMERKSYVVPERDGWFGGTIPAEIYPRLIGAVDLISGGAYFDFGFQFRFQNKISIELGVIAGRAWINQENNYLTLHDHTPYNLEPEKESLQEGFDKGITGAFIQPMFNVGYSF